MLPTTFVIMVQMSSVNVNVNKSTVNVNAIRHTHEKRHICLQVYSIRSGPRALRQRTRVMQIRHFVRELVRGGDAQHVAAQAVAADGAVSPRRRVPAADRARVLAAEEAKHRQVQRAERPSRHDAPIPAEGVAWATQQCLRAVGGKPSQHELVENKHVDQLPGYRVLRVVRSDGRGHGAHERHEHAPRPARDPAVEDNRYQRSHRQEGVQQRCRGQ